MITWSSAVKRQWLTALLGVKDHVQVEATRGIYQRMIGVYRDADRAKGWG